MPNWLHRTDKTLLHSVASADLPQVQTNYIEEPDLSAVVGQPVRYWEVSGDIISLANPGQRNAIDAALLSVQSDSIANELETSQTIMKAFSLVVLDEINVLRAQHSLSARTIAQLKVAVRNKLDG